MKQKIISHVIMAASSITITFSQNIKYADVLNDVGKQTNVLLQEVTKVKVSKPDLASPRTVENGELKMVSSRDWTSGFFPGQLWFLYEYTRKNEWKQQAESFTANL